jgi:hypothetical protein
MPDIADLDPSLSASRQARTASVVALRRKLVESGALHVNPFSRTSTPCVSAVSQRGRIRKALKNLVYGAFDK